MNFSTEINMPYSAQFLACYTPTRSRIFCPVTFFARLGIFPSEEKCQILGSEVFMLNVRAFLPSLQVYASRRVCKEWVDISAIPLRLRVHICEDYIPYLIIWNRKVMYPRSSANFNFGNVTQLRIINYTGDDVETSNNA